MLIRGKYISQIVEQTLVVGSARIIETEVAADLKPAGLRGTGLHRRGGTGGKNICHEAPPER